MIAHLKRPPGQTTAFSDIFDKQNHEKCSETLGKTNKKTKKSLLGA